MSFVGASPTTCTNNFHEFRKGSLTGKAVVLKTTARSACGFESCPFRQFWRRRLMVWQRFAKSPRVACAGSSPVASAKLSGPVAQWNQSATLRRSRSHVQIVPGPPDQNHYGVAESERRESLKLVYVGSNPTSVANSNGDEREMESGLIFNQLICEFESRHPCQFTWVVAQR